MKLNKWTVGLATGGVVSLASAVHAEEQVMSQVLTAVTATTLSGYVDVGAMWAPGTSGEAPTPARFNDGNGSAGNKLNGFNLNVVGITIEKPLGEEEWASGYNVSMILGPDAVAYNPSANGAQDSDFGLKQAGSP